jgi:hypothetical protein
MKEGLLPAAIGIESELRHDQHFASDILQGKIEFSGSIFKDPEIREFAGKKGEILFAIPFPHPDKDEKTSPDLSGTPVIHINRRRLHPLNDRPHRNTQCSMINTQWSIVNEDRSIIQ